MWVLDSVWWYQQLSCWDEYYVQNVKELFPTDKIDGFGSVRMSNISTIAM